MQTLVLHKATKSFGKKEILKDVNFTLETGEILGIFGRNGSGKSTLLKLLFGLLKPDSFEATQNGVVLNPSEVIRRQNIAYLPQHHFLPKGPRVRDIILMYSADEKTQDRVFYDPGVAKLTAKRVGELSLGELKYFEFILVASGNHPFLMLDEPFSMIDPIKKDGIKAFLKKIQSEKGILLTDHYYDDVLQTTTKNMVLKDGVGYAITTTTDLQKFEYLRK